MSKKERGRPMCSHHVRIVPEYRDTPDMEKLGQALISVAVNIAEKKKDDFRYQYCCKSSYIIYRREGGMT